MKDTPNSRTERANIRGKESKFPTLSKQNLPSKLISKWPATIFAERRTERVIGRIKFLTVSISTIKFISWTGVPEGTKWDIIWEKFFDHPIAIKETQKVKAIVKEMVKWAVGVKEKGVRAIRFIAKHAKKILITIFVAIFFSWGYIKEESSFLRKLDKIVDKTIVFLLIFRKKE